MSIASGILLLLMFICSPMVRVLAWSNLGGFSHGEWGLASFNLVSLLLSSCLLTLAFGSFCCTFYGSTWLGQSCIRCSFSTDGLVMIRASLGFLFFVYCMGAMGVFCLVFFLLLSTKGARLAWVWDLFFFHCLLSSLLAC